MIMMSIGPERSKAMMTYDRTTAVSMIGTMLLDHDLVCDQGLHDGSPARNARSQAADLIDAYGENTGQDVAENVPAQLVLDILNELCDEVGERIGERPETPTAFTAFRC
jgi:hypothetical protein